PCWFVMLGCTSTNCNQLLTDAQGEITSPCYPQKYPNSQTCTWTTQAPAGFIIQLTFLDFDLEEAPGCIYDQVVVNTGNANVTFCGLTANGLTLNSTGNVMDLFFKSDFSVQKKGFSVSFRHVAVALRNQKVSITGGNGRITQLADTVSIPTLNQLTICFEVQRITQKQKEWLFTYTDSSSNTALSLGTDGSGMTLTVDGVNCVISSLLSPAAFTSQMKLFCIVWDSTNGRVAVYANGVQWFNICSTSKGHSVPGGGQFRLGGSQNFDGYIYNLRLWDFAMAVDQLYALTCDMVGNVIDWDNSYWTIPFCSKDDLLSRCFSNIHHPLHLFLSHPIPLTLPPATLSPTTSSTDATNIINATNATANGKEPSSSPSTSFSNHLLMFFSVDSLFFICCFLLPAVTFSTSPINGHNSFFMFLIENCPEESLLQYYWPETGPRVTKYLPCLLNKDQNASRTCRYASPPANQILRLRQRMSKRKTVKTVCFCADNAADVAVQLVEFSKNLLHVVKKVKELVSVAKVNSTLASSVVSIISNVMTSADTVALKTVDDLAQKIEFDGPSINITSRNLVLGILAFNTSTFNGASFSAFRTPNSTEPQIDFESDRMNPLAQITLPASLLSNVSDRSSLSRINFMFFNNTNFFQTKQDGRYLNSYVVASSVGNLSISGLKDPVQIEIAHLSEQSSNPVCVFWDFSMNSGTGGWNREGCTVSKNFTNNRTVCLCDHLTHFAILMDISRTSSHIDPQNNKILTFITYVGCGVSAIFTAVTLLTYIAFEKLRRDYPSKILMNLSASLLFLNMVFLLDGWLASLGSDWLCQLVAVFLHYFLLTSFTWMGLESIHMYIALVKVFNTYVRRYILKFCIVSPALVVVIVVAVNKQHYKLLYDGGSEGLTPQFCWIDNAAVFYTTCVGYFCLVFLLNVAMFIVVMMQICGRNGKRSNRTLREEVLRNLRSAISLTFLLGMTWGFALFAWGPVNLAFTYLFTIFNSLQGLFIFIFHCALKENVQKQWRRYLCCGQLRLSDNSDWSKTATNNTKKVSSDNLGKSLSSSSFGSSTANWTSKAKASLNPFTKRHSNTG
uniref:Adhesion G-protein coupled receptor G6 n=1 Tax=Anabas testudineus TaxID=64144 RepID=A0A3Q1IHQ9_ANATE